MPRVVRNFWIEGSVDGAKKDIGTGPRKPGGGFSLNIYVREHGDISDSSSRIGGRCVNGSNVLEVELVEAGHVRQRMELTVDRDESKELNSKQQVVEEPKEEEVGEMISRPHAFWKIEDSK